MLSIAMEIEPEEIKSLSDDSLKQLFSNAIPKALEVIRSNISGLAPNTTGRLKDSIKTMMMIVDNKEVSGKVYSESPYAAVVEYGRTPGSPPPPVDAILAWMETVGGFDFTEGEAKAPGAPSRSLKQQSAGWIPKGSPLSAAQRIAFVIARNIAKDGIPPVGFFAKGLEQSMPEVQEIFNNEAESHFGG